MEAIRPKLNHVEISDILLGHKKSGNSYCSAAFWTGCSDSWVEAVLLVLSTSVVDTVPLPSAKIPARNPSIIARKTLCEALCSPLSLGSGCGCVSRKVRGALPQQEVGRSRDLGSLRLEASALPGALALKDVCVRSSVPSLESSSMPTQPGEKC